MGDKVIKTCEHQPDARNICHKCGDHIFYLDFGGPGSGGVWVSEKEWKEQDDKLKTSPVAVKWESKSGSEILADIRRAMNEK